MNKKPLHGLMCRGWAPAIPPVSRHLNFKALPILKSSFKILLETVTKIKKKKYRLTQSTQSSIQRTPKIYSLWPLYWHFPLCSLPTGRQVCVKLHLDLILNSFVGTFHPIIPYLLLSRVSHQHSRLKLPDIKQRNR
jgi:hypothetical protein